MTALAQYKRLESLGIWRRDSISEPVEVVVSFGQATLVLSDPSTEIPLTHWSLPAICRLNVDALPAIYAPAARSDGEEHIETLEISDCDMIDAISRVHQAIDAVLPHPGRLRIKLIAASAIAVLAGAVWFIPGWLVDHTVNIAPPAQRAAIGQAILGDIVQNTVPNCRRTAGDIVLARLGERLGEATKSGQPSVTNRDGDLKPKIVVFPAGFEDTIVLPGGYVLVGPELIGLTPRLETKDEGEDYSHMSSARPMPRPQNQKTQNNHAQTKGVTDYSPDRLAGAVLAAIQYASENDPLQRALAHAGPASSFLLLTGRNVPSKRFSGYGKTVLEEGPSLPKDFDALSQRFKALGISPVAYAESLPENSPLRAALLQNDPFKGQPHPRPILSESEWAALQDICTTR